MYFIGWVYNCPILLDVGRVVCSTYTSLKDKPMMSPISLVILAPVRQLHYSNNAMYTTMFIVDAMPSNVAGYWTAHL